MKNLAMAIRGRGFFYKSPKMPRKNDPHFHFPDSNNAFSFKLFPVHTQRLPALW
jgi:hypothetical protein